MGPRPATVPAPCDWSGAEEVQPGPGPRRVRREPERGRAPERARRLRSTPGAPAAHRHARRRGAAQRRGSPALPACVPPPHRRARSAVHAPAPLAVARAGWRYSSPACPGHAPVSRPGQRPRWRHAIPIGPPAAHPLLHRLRPAGPKMGCSGRSRYADLRSLRRHGATAPPAGPKMGCSDRRYAGLRGLRGHGATVPPGRRRPDRAPRMLSSPRHWPLPLPHPLPPHRHPGHTLRSAKQAAQADRGSAPDRRSGSLSGTRARRRQRRSPSVPSRSDSDRRCAAWPAPTHDAGTAAWSGYAVARRHRRSATPAPRSRTVFKLTHYRTGGAGESTTGGIQLDRDRQGERARTVRVSPRPIREAAPRPHPRRLYCAPPYCPTAAIDNRVRCCLARQGERAPLGTVAEADPLPRSRAAYGRTTAPASRRSGHSWSGARTGAFSESPRGAAASPLLYARIETAKANGREPYAYLRELFEKLPLARTRADCLALSSVARPPPSPRSIPGFATRLRFEVR